MDIPIAILVAWLVVTLIGHGSWVIVRAVFRAFINVAAPPSRPGPTIDEKADIAATRRVIGRLTRRNLLNESAATELRDQLWKLELTQNLGHDQGDSSRRSDTVEQVTGRPDAGSPVREQKPTADSTPSTTARPDVAEYDAPLTDVPHDDFFPPPRQQADTHSDPRPIKPDPAHSDPAHSDPAQPVLVHSVAAQSVPAPRAAPILSKSELIQSFLAAHNIRWGELVAGMLIVTCSIGLVISLWNTLVQTHRVIPSLIFLGANAAIYAAGLYTLSRWRLRHTSRAVLVIATLLVPLSVLAGLAAAGTSASAVQLGDPITIAAIGLAGAVYIFLLYRGAKALSRRLFALPMVLSIAGPVALLPLVPATVRTLGPDAGWLICIGSLAVTLSSFWVIRLHKRKNLSLGVAGGRTRLLMMGFGSYSLAVAIGYIAFALRGQATTALLPIGIATIPALVGLAGTSRSLMTTARSSVQSLTGAVTCVILIGLAWTVLPPAMVSATWLWSWATAFSLSAAFVGGFFGQPRWLLLATFPLGMAATFSSPVWLGDQQWATVSLHRHLFGGEPMIAASFVAIGVALIMRVTRDSVQRRWVGYAAVTWTAVALVIATVLAVAPAASLGVAPWWSVTLVLATGSITTIYFATRHHAWAMATVGTVTFGWFSCFRPIRWERPLAETDSQVWMMTLLAVSATMLVLRELLPRLALLRSGDRRLTRRSGRSWQIAAVIAALIAGAIACVSVGQDWAASAATLAAVSAVVFWSSTTTRSVELVRVAQLATVAVAIVVGYGRYDQWLFDRQAWLTLTAPWSWALLAASVAGLWLVIRQLAISQPAPLRRRLHHLCSAKAVPSLMPDGWALATGAAFVSVGAVWTFAHLLMQAVGIDVGTHQFTLWLPLAAMAACGMGAAWTMRQVPDNASGTLAWSGHIASSLIIAVLIWGSCQVADLSSSAAQTRLVVATSLAAIGCWGLPLLLVSRVHVSWSEPFGKLGTMAGVLMLVVSSTLLLVTRWLDPILDGSHADGFSTISVSSWWTLAATGLLWKARQSAASVHSATSALLVPSAAALIVPVFSLVHPFVWIQVAAIASVAWVGICGVWLRGVDNKSARPAIAGSMYFTVGVGVITSLLVTVSIVLGIQSLHPVFGIAGLVVSLLAVLLLCHGDLHLQARLHDAQAQLPWPIGLSILAGQFAWLAYWLGLVSGVHVIEMVPAIWGIAAAASLARYRLDCGKLDFFHIGFANVAVAIIAMMLGLRSELMPWVALAVLATGGLLVALVGSGSPTSTVRLGASRLLGWFVGLAGGYLLVSQIAPDPRVQWTMFVIWLAIWIIAWRMNSSEFQHQSKEPNRGRQALAMPDIEFSVLLLVAAILEVVLSTFGGRDASQSNLIVDPLLWVRILAYVVVGFSAVARAGRNHVWTCSIGTLVTATSLVVVELAIHFDATPTQRFVWAALPSGFAIAFVSHWLPSISRLGVRLTGGSNAELLARLIRSTWQVALVVAVVGGTFAVLMIVGDAPAAETQLTIITVALAAWAIAEMAQASDSSRLRHAAVSVSLITIGLWASVDSGETSQPLLTASMRWLVASVFTIPMLLGVFPKLLGSSIAGHWRPAFHRGARIAACTAGVALVSMLVMEAGLRGPTGIEGVSWAMVIGVAVTLSILSALSGLVAILSGPGSTWSQRMALSDQQRIQLIVAAQLIAAVTCLHILLCKSWSFLGLRAYWPYVVMALAFLSVGATQWARRREDWVMSKTLAQSALYLPLIPVIGFWLSGAIQESSWAFQGAKVRYDLLLAIGSVYYIGIAALWKGTMPRVAAVVLGNAAWWVVLVQQPGWSFLAHPQAWLIPPAICVLVVGHLYREKLEPAIASGIRYGATLVIYISSTADILLQQIGTNIFGPIFLVILALGGMAAGVVLRVRPFLYLGAMFVFVGVTSMVWHAQESIDAVWPWWVFGITAGICLLAGLMAIEKNKPKLREYARNLETWHG